MIFLTGSATISPRAGTEKHGDMVEKSGPNLDPYRVGNKKIMCKSLLLRDVI